MGSEKGSWKYGVKKDTLKGNIYLSSWHYKPMWHRVSNFLGYMNLVLWTLVGFHPQGMGLTQPVPTQVNINTNEQER
jgi:hypothetical protein